MLSTASVEVSLQDLILSLRSDWQVAGQRNAHQNLRKVVSVAERLFDQIQLSILSGPDTIMNFKESLYSMILLRASIIFECHISCQVIVLPSASLCIKGPSWNTDLRKATEIVMLQSKWCGLHSHFFVASFSFRIFAEYNCELVIQVDLL